MNVVDDAQIARRRLLDDLLAAEGLDGAATVIEPRGSLRAPLSFAQEVLWLLDRAAPELTAYNVAVCRRLRGPFGLDALRGAVNELSARHEILRTVFRARGESAEQIVLPVSPADVVVEDLGEHRADEREAAALAVLRRHADTRFDLSAAPAFRTIVARIGADDHLLMLVTHHIVSDARSYAILFDELAQLYTAAVTGTAHALPPLALHFGDVAAWQRDSVRSGERERTLAYWRVQLDGVESPALPTDRLPSTERRDDGAVVRTALDVPATAALHDLAERHAVTPYIVVLAAWQTLLHRYTGSTDIVVGSAVDGRTRSELESMIGYFSPALPMRTSFAGDPPFATVLERVRATVAAALEHHDVPPDALVRARDGATAAPLFRSVLTMQDGETTPPCFGAATSEVIEIDGSQTKFDLTLFPVERDGALTFALWYRRDVYDEVTIRRMLDHLLRILAAATADANVAVARIALLSPGERATLAELNATTAPFPFVALGARVAGHARRQPDAPALVAGSQRLGYRELDERAAAVAARLRANGVAPGDRVAIALDRCNEAVVAMLGVWKAGAAYVPIDVGAPVERRAAQIATAAVAATVGLTCDRARLDAAGLPNVIAVDDAAPLATNAAPYANAADDVAYVLFTSGSSGTPKGVAVTHGNVAAYADAILTRLEHAPAKLRCASVTTTTADLGNTSVFAALASGGTLHVVPAEVATDPAQFAAFASTIAIDVLKITPSHLRALLDGAPARSSILPRYWLVLGGEPCPWSLVESVLASAEAPRILNHYGPTETTVGACTFEVTLASMRAARDRGAQTAPIGLPLANVQLHVLDAAGEPVPFGVHGELYIAGAGVAAGYVRQPELTAERFVHVPEGGRAYRTGDRVRRLPGGELEFLGRTDLQFKVRGYRVEPGEIEAALRSHPAVAQAVAVLRRSAAGADIVAYIVPARGRSLADPLDSVRAHLVRALPDYMIPSAIVSVDAFPLTSNGKVDRAALAAGVASVDGAATYEAPSTATERVLAALWEELLGRERVGVNDHFFALGGHSLVAIRVLGRISRSFGVRLPLRTLFDTPVLSALAALVDARSGDVAAPSPPTFGAATRHRRPEGVSS